MANPFFFQQRDRQRPRLLQAAVLFSPFVLLLALNSAVGADGLAKQLQQEYDETTQPLVVTYCLDCHSTSAREGELDLERFSSFIAVRKDPHAWQQVAKMLSTREMPPKDSPQPTPDEMLRLEDWVDRYLDGEARASAGDPGPVVLRRLNNAEYTYTVGDLTGLDIDPTREFPTDGAAGEGFTNTGNALSMSPAMVSKYLDAAKGIADHIVLLPEGFRFSAQQSRRDWTNEILTSIRKVYFRNTGDLGDASTLNHWDVSDPTKLTLTDGRVDLEAYFRVLNKNRNRLLRDISTTKEIAQSEGLSATYLQHLTKMLRSKKPSMLLDQIRSHWKSAKPDNAREIAKIIREWQDRLFQFNPVGHFGQVKRWQEPVTPLSSAESFRVKIGLGPNDQEATLFLVTGTAGDSSDSDKVVWKRPRIERPGHAPLLLSDLRAASVAIVSKRAEFLANISKYFSAAREALVANTAQDLLPLATAHQVDPIILESWLGYLGISYSSKAVIQDYLDSPITTLAGYDFVKGWGIADQAALSLVANASDNQAKIPGDLNPHKIAVHPRPERWVAVAWQSPLESRVRVSPQVKDAHSQCGNGVSWSLELRSGGSRRVLASGTVDLGTTATIEPLEELAVQRGDLISLVISSRDQNHGCDLTEIELDISELGNAQRSWSLSGDCADSIDAGNPHADQYGNPTIWHFYSGMNKNADDESAIPLDSRLAQWLTTADASKAEPIVAEVEALLNLPLPADASSADAEVYRQLTTLDGPLFSRLDAAALANSAKQANVANAKMGLGPQLFVSNQNNAAQRTENLIVTAPSILEVKIPRAFAKDAELVAIGALADGATGDASAQLLVTSKPPIKADALLPGVPVVVYANSSAEKRFRQSFDEFRSLFPAAMCYPRIVPVDVVVTLILYYREDDHLSRLMLDEEERAALDRLWKELHFVSQDALALVNGFEQLLEFASQDDDPKKYKPLGESIYAAADEFRTQLVKSEPYHLDTLIDFTTRAYRRPLEAGEEDGIRQLYAQLRTEEMSHDEALRLTFARVLAGPAFLYHLERPQAGTTSTLVSDWELASRLSYFLWSSAPDAQLRTTAANKLQEPAAIIAETQRMLQDERVRRLAIEFACQWLHIRDFDELGEKSERHFPTFADLQDDMYEESILFFTDMFQNDGSVLDILNADHTFLNGPLANHYGIPGVEGERWQRVDGVRAYSRGGILAQATILATQSGASRTSPILRGNWISETLLGERLPRPPKDVPVLPENVPEGLTERQLTEQHTSDPSCAKCHARIDPYGFALEEFNAIGQFRKKDASGQPIDTYATLPDGSEIDGIEGIRTYLLTARRDAWVRQFCRKLLGYALGRATQLSDEPLLDDIMRKLAANEYRVSQAIETIVLSDQFRKIRGREYKQGTLAKIGASSQDAP